MHQIGLEELFKVGRQPSENIYSNASQNRMLNKFMAFFFFFGLIHSRHVEVPEPGNQTRATAVTLATAVIMLDPKPLGCEGTPLYVFKWTAISTRNLCWSSSYPKDTCKKNK